jgi:hypothetical protein
MWKIVVAFVAFAALGFWLLLKGGDKIDLGGEKHETSQEALAPKKEAASK